MTRILTATLALALLAPAARADEAKKEDLPVKLKLVAKKDAYKLDLGGKTAEEFKKALKAAAEQGKVPDPPAVDLELQITNTSDKDVQVWIGGDPVSIDFELKGPGAETVKPQVFFTANFIGPKAVEVKAGKTHTIPVTRLAYGFRNASIYSYWVEPGDYTLTAKLKTGISPAPAGIKPEDGFGQVTLTSEPAKIKVEGK